MKKGHTAYFIWPFMDVLEQNILFDFFFFFWKEDTQKLVSFKNLSSN